MQMFARDSEDNYVGVIGGRWLELLVRLVEAEERGIHRK